MEFPISLEFTDKLKASIIVRKHCLTTILGNLTTSTAQVILKENSRTFAPRSSDSESNYTNICALAIGTSIILVPVVYGPY